MRAPDRRDRLRQPALRHDPDLPGSAGRRRCRRDRPGTDRLRRGGSGARGTWGPRRRRGGVRAGAPPGPRVGPTDRDPPRGRSRLGGRRQQAVSAARDPYEVLGVPRTATTTEIRVAYLARARRSHPDLVGPRGLELMRALNEAWSILKDAARRSAFDTASGGTSSAGSGAAKSRSEDSSRPFWTGASGPPPGRPSGPVLDFGIFAGWSV